MFQVTSSGAQIIWEPQAGPQTALLECDVFEVFYGGARGGGKTESSIGDWLQHADLYGEHAIGIFFRRKLVQLAEVIARTKQLFPKLGAKYNEQRKEWVMRNGARLKFAYLERDSDAEEYQGHSYTRVYVEEVTNFPDPGPINKLRATLRSGTGVPVGMRLTGNPGGAGHQWVKARYITPAPKGFKLITETEEIEVDGVKQLVSLSRVFIPSKISDNTLLMRNDPTYILRLRQSGSAALVKAWLTGNWDVVDGAFFSEWSDEHILRTDIWLGKLPGYATRFRAFDWGSAKPFSVGWYIVSDGTWGLPKDALLKYREWYGMEDDKPNVGLKMNVGDVAEGIIRRETGEVIRYGVADPAIFIHDGGPSKAEMMAIRGCVWRRADNKRLAGAQQMHLRLQGVRTEEQIMNEELGIPMLYFLDCCEHTIRTIPALQHDEIDSEDIDTSAEDHAYDETRYGVMSRPWQATPLAPAPLPSDQWKGSLGKTFDQLVAQNKRKRLAAQL
jgi:hypothetical protein